MLDIFTTKTHDSDKGCQMILKIAIVKTVVLSATLSFRNRKTDILFVDSHPSQSFFVTSQTHNGKIDICFCGYPPLPVICLVTCVKNQPLPFELLAVFVKITHLQCKANVFV